MAGVQGFGLPSTGSGASQRLREKKCAVCGLTLESEQLNALGHSYTEWETIAEPTKDTEGEQRRHCINCGDTQLEKIEKLPKMFGIF